MNPIERHAVRATGRDGAPAIVFAHGYGCDQTVWRRVAPAFESTHRVYTFDHAGAGAAASAFDPARHDRLDGYARDLVELMEALDLRDAVLVGHSVSASIGALAINAAPGRVGRLVMVGPSARYLNDGDYRGGFERADLDGLLEALEANYNIWAQAVAPAIMGNVERPELALELADSFCRNDPRAARAFARATFLADSRDDMKALSVPTLILQCARDTIAPESAGQWLHANIRDSRMVLMRATGHCPHVSAPDETIAAIRGFLADEARGQAS